MEHRNVLLTCRDNGFVSAKLLEMSNFKLPVLRDKYEEDDVQKLECRNKEKKESS